MLLDVQSEPMLGQYFVFLNDLWLTFSGAGVLHDFETLAVWSIFNLAMQQRRIFEADRDEQDAPGKADQDLPLRSQTSTEQ